MKITKIERQQKHKDRVNIYVDGDFSFGLTEVLLVDHGLFVGLELSEEQIEKVKKSDELSKAMNKAYNFLSYRQRSEKEMRDKLREKFDEQTAEMAISKLKEHGYINDQSFALSWVAGRGISRGKRALVIELFKKGIAKDIIEESLSSIGGESEFEAALALVRSKEKYKTLIRSEAYKKVAPFLVRRGYSYDVVTKVIAEIYPK